MISPQSVLRWGLPLFLGVAARGGRAQETSPDDLTKPIRFQLTQIYLQTDVDVERESQAAGHPSVTASSERTIVQPVVGLGFAGSVYHPNLLRYDLEPELGLDWEDIRATPGGASNEGRFLQRYRGSLDLLREKPYATSFFGYKDVTYRDYDFFTRVRVESERYGGRGGYLEGPVPITVTAQHYDETQPELDRPSSLAEDTFTMDARNSHRAERGNLQLNLNRDDVLREDRGFPREHSLHYGLSLLDSETFGAKDWIRWTTLLNHNSITGSTLPTSKVQLQERVQLEHTPRLLSYYDYNAAFSSAGDSDVENHQGRAGLRHQLYENLTSNFDLRGGSTHASGPDGIADTTQMGVSFDEAYRRSISSWGRLSLGYGIAVDHEDRDTSGMTLNIIDEQHILRDDGVLLLTQPLVDAATVRVTDSTGTIVYVLGLDYQLIPRGAYTEIQRISGGRIPKGSTILVDYTATLQPSATFTSYSNSANFRFDVWNGVLGFYGRWNRLEYDGGEGLLLRWVDDKTVGIDSVWRWLRTSVEYQLVDANLAPYSRVRIGESLQFQPADRTSLGFDFDQSWTHFPDTGQRETVYGAIVRCRQQFNARLSWDIEGGVRFERGTTFDRDIGTARTELNWAVAKLNVKVGYAYNNESYGTDGRERHHLYVRLRRTFR